MNTSQQIAIVIFNVSGLFVLWVVALCWRDYKIDKLRQDIFDLRADLFAFALEGGVAFSNRSYVALRLLLNSMIRFAHEISFTRLAAALIMEHFQPKLTLKHGFAETMNADDIDSAARTKLQDIHDSLMRKIAVQIITTSVLALPAMVLYCACAVIKHGLLKRYRAAEDAMFRKNLLEKRLNQHIQLIEQQAMETRELELQEHRTAACV